MKNDVLQQQIHTMDKMCSGSVDHFSKHTSQDMYYAGKHLIIDLWGASGLDDMELMRSTLLSGVEACGATLLHIHLHHFTPSGGLSGVAVLAESHISVHTWPECGYGAFDVFMCGSAKPDNLLPILHANFTPSRVHNQECLRGVFKPGF